ncbi:MAG: DinB family protein [Paenibacillaceae bacterium]
MIHRPAATEYSSYFAKYIERVASDDLLHELEIQLNETTDLLADLSEEQTSFRYAQGKWSVKEVVGHMVDTERIMSYRALRIARGDVTPLPGFDENAYVSHSNFSVRSLQSLLQDFSIVRQATLNLLDQLPAHAWPRVGVVSNNEITVRALGFIIAGHELHHRNVIIERYIGAL